MNKGKLPGDISDQSIEDQQIKEAEGAKREGLIASDDNLLSSLSEESRKQLEEMDKI